MPTQSLSRASQRTDFCRIGQAVALGTVSALLASCAAKTREVRVYSGRHYSSDQALYQQFEQATGIKVRLLESKDSSILQRLQREGKNSSADVLILVDAARLANASQAGLFQPIRSDALIRDVPVELRDPNGLWFGLTRRVRAMAINPEVVQPGLVTTYADLAKPDLQGKLCLRNRSNVYNQSLVADQMILRGDAATGQWVKGMVSNLRQPVFTSDVSLARAVAKGTCGIGVVNSYYVARMLAGQTGSADKSLASKIEVKYPNPAHVNVSGAGVTRHAKNKNEAIQLIEYLTSPSAAEGFARGSLEYPLKGFGNQPILRQFGDFRSDGVSAAQLGRKNKEAVALMAANGWK